MWSELWRVENTYGEGCVWLIWYKLETKTTYRDVTVAEQCVNDTCAASAKDLRQRTRVRKVIRIRQRTSRGMVKHKKVGNYSNWGIVQIVEEERSGEQTTSSSTGGHYAMAVWKSILPSRLKRLVPLGRANTNGRKYSSQRASTRYPNIAHRYSVAL